MDYTGLKIEERQIRLISVQPVPAGADPETAPIICEMTVRTQPLRTEWTESMSYGGSLPPNYISFDRDVTELPPEAHVEELRQSLVPALRTMNEQEGSWMSRTTEKLQRKLLHRTQERVLTVPTHGIAEMLRREERLKAMGDNRPGAERRIWAQWGDLRMYEDAAGTNLAFGKAKPLPRVGQLTLRDLNPFFWNPDQFPNLYIQTMKSKLESGIQQFVDNYVALSYAWGPEEPTTEIHINGMPVRVRANLEAALRRFRTMRYFVQGGKLWVDALCINQEDRAEREKQVQMMASIYRNAGNVIVWLGPKTETSDVAIAWLEQLGNDYRAEYAEAFDGSDPVTATTWRAMAQIRMETSYEKFREFHMTEDGRFLLKELAVPLFDFFNRPYWRRLWIIQELCMGRAGMPMVCGKRVTQWRYIRDGVLKYTSVLDLLEEVAREQLMQQQRGQEEGTAGMQETPLLHVAQIAQLEIMGHKRKIASVPTNMLTIVAPTFFEHGPLLGNATQRAILLASRSECSVSHDRIYGMLSIPALSDLGINVDYSKRVAEVFTEFSAACVKNHNLDFFALLDGGYMSMTDMHGKPQDTKKPSWVPDYGAKPARRIGIIDGEWHAGGYVHVICAHPEVAENGYLICSGKVVDTVDGTGAMSRADIEAGALKLTPGDDLADLKQPTSQWHNGTSGEKTIYDVLVGGCDRNGRKAPTSFNCLYSAFPVEEPPKTSPFYRNWHFLKSNADFQINGRPLASYFRHLSVDTWQSEDTPGSSDSQSASKTAAHDTMSTAAARQTMEVRTKMRRFITTKTGLLGIAPVQTQPGDEVIVIPGHGKPLIARKIDTADDEAQILYLIGEAYICGMMEAERMPLSAQSLHEQTQYSIIRELQTLVFV